MTEHHKIQSSGIVEATRGDCGVEISGNNALMPDDVKEALRQNSVSTLEQFISLLQSFPESFAKQIGWSNEDVIKASDQLISDLRGKVDAVFLDVPEESKRPFGAIEPERTSNSAS